MRSQFNPTVCAVTPALIGVCIDRLQRLPQSHARTSEQLLLVATCTGRNEREAAALFVRLVTAAFICRDSRWPRWRSVSQASVTANIAFEALVLDLFATLPLKQDLTASADGFFAALLTRFGAHGIG